MVQQSQTCISSLKISERVLNNLAHYALEAIGDEHHSAPFASIQNMSQECLIDDLHLKIQNIFQFKTCHVKRCMLTFCLDYWFVLQLNCPLISIL